MVATRKARNDGNSGLSEKIVANCFVRSDHRNFLTSRQLRGPGRIRIDENAMSPTM